MANTIIENGSSNVTQPQGDGLPQESFLHIALRHRWIILNTTMIFLVVAFLYLVKATPIYTSLSSVYVEQGGPRMMSEYEGVMTQSKNYLYTQAKLIKSTSIVGLVVEDAQIKRFRTFNEVDNRVAYVKKKLDVNIGKKDDLITITFESPYPEEAAQIVNKAVDCYIDYHASRKQTTVDRVRKIFEKVKLDTDEELTRKYAELVEFTRKNGVVSFDNKGGHIVFQTLTELAQALTEARLVSINAKADYDATKSMMGEPVKIKQFAAASHVAGIPVYVSDLESKLRAELRDAEIKLKNAKYYVTEDHPSVKAIQAKIEYIKNQLDKEAKEFAEVYLEVRQLRWTAAKQRQNELQTSFDTQLAAAQDLGIKATEYLALQSKLEQTKHFSEALNEQIRKLSVTEDTGALNISILEYANPALSPSKPQKAKIMAMALVLGFMFGGGLALLRDWLDFRLRSADEVSAFLGIPVLGVIPTMDDVQTIAARSQKAWLQFKPIVAESYRKIRIAILPETVANKTKAVNVTSTVHGDGRVIAEEQTIMERAQKVRSEFRSMSRKSYRTVRTNVFSDSSQGQTGTVTVNSSANDDVSAGQTIVARGQKVRLKPKSIAAEAYRTVRTAVFFGVPKGEAKTILVTSPAPGDGKSTLASNLAIAMAQAGQKTLIIDADFRKPMQHNIFELENSVGLSSVFSGTNIVDEAIRSSLVKGLDILSCGPEVPNPSEILNSNSFVNVLKELSEEYDRIIIDSPPVGPVADSQILAAVCDITLLVLRAEKSTRRQSQHARDSLVSVGGRLLGAIVNDVPRKRSQYGYYSNYGTYGGYGYYGHDGSRESKKEYK